LIAHFARFGLSIHVGTDEKASKTEILFVAAPPSTYIDPNSYDNIDLSNIDLGDGTHLPIVDEFNYLGSILSRGCSDEKDVTKRISKASNAFGALRKLVFSNGNITLSTKKHIYEGLVLPILLYGAETWSLTEKLYSKLLCLPSYLRASNESCESSLNVGAKNQ